MAHKSGEKQLSVRIPVALYEALEKVAAARACNVSTIVRQLALTAAEKHGLQIALGAERQRPAP